MMESDSLVASRYYLSMEFCPSSSVNKYIFSRECPTLADLIRKIRSINRPNIVNQPPSTVINGDRLVAISVKLLITVDGQKCVWPSTEVTVPCTSGQRQQASEDRVQCVQLKNESETRKCDWWSRSIVCDQHHEKMRGGFFWKQTTWDQVLLWYIFTNYSTLCRKLSRFSQEILLKLYRFSFKLISENIIISNVAPNGSYSHCLQSKRFARLRPVCDDDDHQQSSSTYGFSTSRRTARGLRDDSLR